MLNYLDLTINKKENELTLQKTYKYRYNNYNIYHKHEHKMAAVFIYEGHAVA
jgi:hypothetical protein